MRPIPKGLKAIAAANEASLVLDDVMKAASRDQIITALKKLSLHCGKQNKGAQEIASMLFDYCADLKIYPINLIEEACEKYRLQPGDNEFMPNSGKLITLMADKWAKMKFLRARIDKILGTYEEAAPKQNRMLSFNEALEQLM